MTIDDSPRWEQVAAGTIIDRLLLEAPTHRVCIVGIDGRSRSGKTVLAATLASATEHRAAVIHTDDIAWHHSFFDWTELLIIGVLEPLRRYGPPVSHTPQAWIDRGRPGAIDVPADTRLVIIEGVAATRQELALWFNATIWVDTPPQLSLQRTRELDRDPPGFVEDWMRAENAHLERDRPWNRASLIVSGAERPADTHALYTRSVEQ